VANCFVIMPFKPELGYFYRTVKAHLENAFPGVAVARGDAEVLTRPLLEKIASYIKQADVVLADCTGRNPNVFYELGMAHALEKPVVLLTGDPIDQAPTDIKAYEFISYASYEPDQFLVKLEGALQSVIGNPFKAIYPEAIARFTEFCAAAHLELAPMAEDDFVAAATAMRDAGPRLVTMTGRRRAELLVRRVLGTDPDIAILVALKTWLDQKYPAP
jgi:hypothetical protein